MGDGIGHVSHLLLQTSDLNRLEAFYTDVIGFSVKKRERFGDDQPLVVMHERLGLTEIPPADASDDRVVEHVAFQIDDIDGLVESLHQHDVEIDDGPKSTSYGTSVYFFDPDGNRIECHD